MLIIFCIDGNNQELNFHKLHGDKFAKKSAKLQILKAPKQIHQYNGDCVLKVF